MNLTTYELANADCGDGALLDAEPVDNGDCDMPCPGAVDEICGGEDALLVFVARAA